MFNKIINNLKELLIKEMIKLIYLVKNLKIYLKNIIF
jgi:hypothetical protein